MTVLIAYDVSLCVTCDFYRVTFARGVYECEINTPGDRNEI